MNMKNRKGQKGSLMAQVTIVIMLGVALTIALISLNMMEYKKSLNNDMYYQAQLCSKSSIDAIIQLLNSQEELIPPQGQSLDLDVEFASRMQGNTIGDVTQAKMYWQEDVLVIETSSQYMSSEATMKGYVQNQDGIYMVKYYESK